MAAADSVESVAHVIQVALTPIFLFSGVATLLSVLSVRLGRVADHVDALAERLETASPAERRRYESRLAYLRRRSRTLDLAVILAALAGMSTLLAGGLLFVGTLRDHAGSTLFVAFGVALILTIGALVAFLCEMLLASIGIRSEAAKTAEQAEPAEAPEAPDATHETGDSGGASP